MKKEVKRQRSQDWGTGEMKGVCVYVCETVNRCLPPAPGWLTTSLETSAWGGVSQLLCFGHKWIQKDFVIF